ncbi:hypothetical protein FZC83_07190 [Rossellomorea marisflavi]|uniref:Uncharacterized protein n=1 Tax=Rossellomorea marisflavi TaxID=189381 RepID=A0A5D4RTN1_9BACI|nr:hypothetical protein [Rossellomorea marisflavi]TYS54725.1 hypothetical protein FZC83_07190 [Rossellomorea marisflavi]
MLDKINDINLALNNKNYLSALALSLTLPDICGAIEYPHFIHKNGKRNVGKQYAAWFDNRANRYFADNTGWTKDYTRAKNPYFTGEMCYSLRCSFLHDGNSNIKNWDNKEDTDFFYSYEFELAIGGANSFGLSWATQSNNDSKIMKTKTVRVNIYTLCKSICVAADNYYREKDPILFKDHNIILIDFNSFKNR